MIKKITAVAFVCILAQPLHAQYIPKVKIQDVLKMADTSSVPLVINFWATWCAPCVKEIPWFEKNIGNFKGKVKLLLVSLDFADEYPKGIAAFAANKGIKSSIVWLNETDADMFCPKIDTSWQGAIPATLMINNKKKYRRFYGQQLPEPKFIQELNKLVE